MASNVEEDYDSDTELVPDYDMVDLNDFKLTMFPICKYKLKLKSVADQTFGFYGN